MIGIENVHCVDDHRRIRGIFSVGVAVLLNGIDGILEELFFPASF